MAARTARKAAKAREAPAASRPLSLCDGRDWLGNIVERDGKFVAFDTAGKTLGTFPTLRQAADAVTDAQRERAARIAPAPQPPARRAARSTATPGLAPRRKQGKSRHAA